MIRYQKKRPAIPAVLKKKAAAATDELWAKWRKAKCLEEKDFQRAIYGHAEVKRTLIKTQGNKCAFCETPFVRDYGQVEHFRPKAGCKQNSGDLMQKPGYFWLTYEWKNLCVSCAMCNDGGHKGNVFPLENPTQRAHPKKPSTKHERPLLLSPFDDAPEEHIDWHADMPRAKHGSLRGQVTINVFKLDTDESLVDSRRTHLKIVRALLEGAESKSLPPEIHAQYLTVLNASLMDTAPYAAMIRSAFAVRISALIADSQ